MQALILAAGMGSRLRNLTKDKPKALLPFNGQPLLLRNLDVITQHPEVDEIIIVVGYLKENIIECLGHKHNGIKITYVENDLYDSTNNIYSFYLASDFIKEDFLLFECDVVFEDKMLDLLITETNTTALVAKHQAWMDGTVIELDPATREIKRMISKKDQQDYDYKNAYKTVNIYKITHDFFLEYLLPGMTFYVEKISTNSFYELILGMFCYLGVPKIYGLDAGELLWYEIDDQTDLKQAEYIFCTQEEKYQIIKKQYGGFWRYSFLDYHYLYNMYFPNQPFLNSFKPNFKNLVLQYPSGSDAIADMVSQWINVPSDDIVVGNGSAEIIRILVRRYFQKVTLLAPGFNEYENTLNSNQVDYYYLEDDDFKLDPNKYIQHVKNSGSNAVVIINPNNPTSMYIPKDDIIKILKGLQHLDLIVLDESFIDFVNDEASPSLLDSYHGFKNLIILKSVSKAFGVAGIRLGYIVGSNKEIINTIKQEIPIWNINSLAENFLENILNWEKDYSESFIKSQLDRKYLYNALNTFDEFVVYPPQANYIFIKLQCNMSSSQVERYLFVNHNIYVKDCSNKSGLKEDYIRVSIRTRKDNESLLDALKEMILSRQKKEKVLVKTTG